MLGFSSFYLRDTAATGPTATASTWSTDLTDTTDASFKKETHQWDEEKENAKMKTMETG